MERSRTANSSLPTMILTYAQMHVEESRQPITWQRSLKKRVGQHVAEGYDEKILCKQCGACIQRSDYHFFLCEGIATAETAVDFN